MLVYFAFKDMNYYARWRSGHDSASENNEKPFKNSLCAIQPKKPNSQAASTLKTAEQAMS